MTRGISDSGSVRYLWERQPIISGIKLFAFEEAIIQQPANVDELGHINCSKGLIMDYTHTE